MQAIQRNKCHYIIPIFFFIVLFSIQMQNKCSAQKIAFESLGLEDGLSELAGLCIEQDQLGRIWIGTRNGLNCWDGIRMKTFYPQRGDTTSLASHKVSALKQVDKYLWARSGTSLSRLDLETLSFNRYYIEGLYSIGIYNNTLIAGTTNGKIYTYHKEREEFVQEELFEEIDGFLSVVYQDKNNDLWISSDDKKQIYRISGKNKETIDIPVEDKFVVYDLLTDSRNRLWIATRYHGLLVYDIEEKTFKEVNTSTAPYYVESLSVRKIIKDEDNRLWVGTFKGLAIFDLEKETTSFIRSDEGEQGLSHNSVFSLHISKDNNIWVGTYFGGVDYGRISNQVFTRYNESESGEGPSYAVMGELIEDKDNNIWIGTEGGGLDYYNRQKNSFINYPATGDNKGLSQTNIKSLFLSDNNELLVGTYQGGLNILDLKTSEFEHYNSDEYKNAPYHVNHIVEHQDDYILATENGVIRFDPTKKEFNPLLDPEIYVGVCIFLYIDSKEILWIGTTGNGLFAYNLKTKELKRYRSDDFDTKTIAANSVNYILEDHRFRLWFGTDGGGLSLFNRKKETFTTYNQQYNNLPSDFIYGISESRFGNLWIATNKGLSRFDVEDNQFFNYTNESGFPLKELNYKSLLLTNEGELFVGGIDGLISFKEQDLLMIDEDLTITFSSLFVNNKEVRANDETGILSRDISVAESFILKPQHTVFSIDFSSLNYNHTLNNKYQYQLEGFNEEWVNAEFTTSATYTNLNPGKYTFKVRATDVAYKPITKEKSIQITIQPPLTRTWYAYTFYVLVFLGLILLFNYFYLGKVRLQYQLRNERDEKERIKELNQYKLRFFTNISHEFMTPLTIILSSLEHAFSKYKISGRLNWQLGLALRNAKRLKNLNSELLDFRKIEQGHLKLKVQKNDIVSYLENIYTAFEEIANSKEIEYTIEKEADLIQVYYDARQMDKVFYNLLSNAINHVPAGRGEIRIKLIEKPEVVEINVTDNGAGISKEDVDKVFNRFFHHDSKYTESAYRGSGIGLALTQSIILAHKGTIICESEKDKGTRFTVTLKKGSDHFSAEEISVKSHTNVFSIDKELIHLSEENGYEEQEILELKDEGAPVLLIVDDNAEIRMAIKSLFTDSFRIITANDGLDGLEKALEIQPDIIISDVLMPKLSGFEMCKKLKANLNTSHIPVLLLTALDSEEDRTIAFKHGADSYCTKPFSSEMLQARVDNLFQNRELVQQKYSTDPTASPKTITQNVVDREFIKKARTIIEENILNYNFNVDEFAVEMNMGRTIFYSKVKSITGQTPNDFIQTVRLKKAADMLINTPGKNVSEIAYDTGFNSPRYFALAFKKHFGVNPSKYGK